MEKIEELKNIIKNSQNICIFPSEKIDKKDFAKVLALFYSLKKIKKNVNLLIKEDLEKLPFYFKKFVISIDNSEKISEIYYEKNKKNLKIYLNLDNGEIKKEDINFSAEKDLDLIITISKEQRDFPSSFYKTAFLNLKPENIEKIIEILQKDIEYQQLLDKQEIKLLLRIFRKLNFNKEKEVHFCCLDKIDFQETKTSSKDLGFAIKELKLDFLNIPTLFILWESHLSIPAIKGVFYSQKESLVKKISENFKGIFKKRGGLFLTGEAALDKAKEKVFKIV